MNALSRLYAGFMALLRAYPALATALMNVVVALGAKFGLDLSPEYLVAVIAGFNALLGILGHRATIKPKQN